jgi:transcriptional regulator with XRE-family HTH domain
MIGYLSDMGTTRNSYNVAVGNAVKKARLTAGLTQSQVAHSLMKDEHTVYQYENGLRSISTPTAYELASTLNVSPKEFYPDPEELAAQVNAIKKGNNAKKQEEK